MCCNVSVPTVITCAICRRTVTIQSWVEAGAWETRRWSDDPRLWRRVVGWLTGPIAFCSETCAARSGVTADADGEVAEVSASSADRLRMLTTPVGDGERRPILVGSSGGK